MSSSFKCILVTELQSNAVEKKILAPTHLKQTKETGLSMMLYFVSCLFD